MKRRQQHQVRVAGNDSFLPRRICFGGNNEKGNFIFFKAIDYIGFIMRKYWVILSLGTMAIFIAYLMSKFFKAINLVTKLSVTHYLILVSGLAFFGYCCIFAYVQKGFVKLAGYGVKRILFLFFLLSVGLAAISMESLSVFHFLPLGITIYTLPLIIIFATILTSIFYSVIKRRLTA